MRANFWSFALCSALAMLRAMPVCADEASDVREQLRELQRQNAALQQQLQNQHQLMETLSRKVSELQGANETRAHEYRSLKAAMDNEPPPSGGSAGSISFGKVRLSGQGGLAWLHTGSEGAFPNAEFRVDEAKLFVDAQLVENVYFFTELNITTREQMNSTVQFGEVYVDFENVSRLWGRDRMLNVRVGRFDIPFGEEYLVRDAIDNPLISHSVSDVWGVDEGVEVYGSIGKFDYALAVQNGGVSSIRDFDADKSVAGRIGFEPSKWLRLSVSGMRTGDLDASDDFVSELWFGPGLIRSLGAPATTTKFHAELVEGDVQLRLARGHFKAAGGYVHYDDNDTAANNQRDMYYYYVEGVGELTERIYAAARFSHIHADKGFPIVGNGEFNSNFFGVLTEDLWRLSLGIGYRWSNDLALKVEYSIDRGERIDGTDRNNEDLAGVELAFRF